MATSLYVLSLYIQHELVAGLNILDNMDHIIYPADIISTQVSDWTAETVLHLSAVYSEHEYICGRYNRQISLLPPSSGFSELHHSTSKERF